MKADPPEMTAQSEKRVGIGIPSPDRLLWPVALLLFGSGFCSLVYQSVWLRQFRLVFGASTSASAAVIAIFMGGIGLGSALLGRRIERAARPLAVYGWLEVGIALSAAISPALLWLVGRLYIALGGSFALGVFAAPVRLVLATLVLAVPTFLMGGTLPAAARSCESEADVRRRNLAILYGANALGAVFGVLVPTFILLEIYGNRTTLWLAALFNGMVGLLALLIARWAEARPDTSTEEPVVSEAVGSRRFIFAAAAIVGFAFFLMELVWYRMLTPLLGGTTFTFGLILAVALLGIGLGSAAYSLASRGARSTLLGFALTCALEALLLALPYALGDRLAVLALLLRPLGRIGFFGFVLGWSLVTTIVVLPAAFVAGIQFPLLIGLLGRGRKGVARDVGLAYAWNTVGAIGGSIAGGFGLLPLLSAPGTWKVVVVVLAVLSAAAAFRAFFPERRRRTLAVLALDLAAVALLLARGPTAAWRHTPIGAGRADELVTGKNSLRKFLNERRRSIEWEVDGVESSVALARDDGYAFMVNGKSDGHARYDAGTQVMGGILGAVFHPEPRAALVVGLGTGSTAGWLAAVPSIQRVDVVEIERAIVEVARACTAVNHDAMADPKIVLHIGDGREFILTRDDPYDIISSEPSNPYRAGIASLLTVEFYRAIERSLKPDGIFLQFLQAYEIDSRTLRIIYASVSSAFPHIETYETRRGDLLLVASREPLKYDVPMLRARLQQEPFRSAIKSVWRVTDLEGFLAHFVAGSSAAAALSQGMQWNTDDRTIVEYAFARTLGDATQFDVGELRRMATRLSDAIPPLQGGSVDLLSVQDQRLSMIAAESTRPVYEKDISPDQLARSRAHIGYVMGELSAVLKEWVAQSRPPKDPTEMLTFAEAVAEVADERAIDYIEPLRAFNQIEADVALARLRWRQRRLDEAADALTRAFIAYRADPWPLTTSMRRVLDLAVIIAQANPAQAPRIYESLHKPFSIKLADEQRRLALLGVATVIEQGRCGPQTIALVESFEPDIPWYRAFLANRAECYRESSHPRADRAARDLRDFMRNEPRPLDFREQPENEKGVLGAPLHE